jgi:hypothetical protein
MSSHYAPGQERSLRAYAVIAGSYAAALSGSLLALHARGHELPQRPRRVTCCWSGSPRTSSAG